MLKRMVGFTLIELVMVIVIIGILAAVAVPQFIDLSSDAKTAAANSMAGALSSANAVNYAARKANSSKGVAIAKCADVANAMQGGATTVTGTYSITPATAIAADASATCTLTLTATPTVTASFTATGIT